MLGSTGGRANASAPPIRAAPLGCAVPEIRRTMMSHVVFASALPYAFEVSRSVVRPRSRGTHHREWARYRCACAPARDVRRCSGRTFDTSGCVSLSCSMFVAQVTSPARSRVLHTPSRVPRPVASERALATALAAALDGVCDIQSWGDVAAGGEWSGHRAPRDDEKTLSISKICATISSDKLWLKVV